MPDVPQVNYDAVELTEDELKAAILEGKKRKYFREKHADYWQDQEKPTRKKKEPITKEKP